MTATPLHTSSEGSLLSRIEYNAEPIDSGAALYVLACYQHARVVNIDGHCLTAGQLLPLVKGGYIGDAVISFRSMPSVQPRTHLY